MNQNTLTNVLSDIKKYIQQTKNTKHNKTTNPTLVNQDSTTKQQKHDHFLQLLISALQNTELNENDAKPISAIKTSFELIVAWGINPRLLDGIGIPLEKRTKSTMHFTRSTLTNDEKLSTQQCEKLFQYVNAILEICERSKFFKAVIYNYYIPDVLSALIQLVYHPVQERVRIVDVKTLTHKSTPKDLAVYEVCGGLNEQDKKKCKDVLQKMFVETPEQRVVEALLMLNKKNAPKWFTSICGILLSRSIMRPRGVYAVLNATLAGTDEGNVKAFERVARLITIVPKQCASVELYYKKICPQLLSLMRVSGKNVRHLQRGSLLCIGKMIERNPKLAKEYLLDPITKPLRQFIDVQENKIQLPSKGEDPLNEGRIIIDENELVQSVEDIHRILIGNGPSEAIYNSITYVITALFQLYCFISKTKLYLKSACEEIITTYFKLSDDALKVIKRLVVFKPISEDEHKVHATFAAGETGGVCIKQFDASKRDYLWEAECIIQLLKLMKNDDVAGDLFVHLVEQFTLLKQSDSFGEDSILLLHMIKLIIDSLGSAIMRNTSQAISFAKFLILNHEDDDSEEGIDTIAMALGILSTIVSGGIIVQAGEDEQKLEDILPLLQRLNKHPNQQISEMAASVSLGIDTKQYKVSGDEKTDKETKTKLRLKSIINDLKDPILPVRAYAIQRLKKLVLEKDEVIQKNLKKVLSIFEAELKDEDTFVYLGAIQGLSALGDVYPKEVIPILTTSFRETKSKPEQRAKVGEALLAIARRCGDMLPHYAHHFVYTFLACAKEKNGEHAAMIRASSLSNLATIAEILRFGIHKYMQDIIDCATGLLTWDEDVQVRNAAVHIFSRIVKGLGEDVFEVMPDHVKQIVQLLKKVNFYDKNELVKENAKIALLEIKDVLKDRLAIEYFTEWQFK